MGTRTFVLAWTIAWLLIVLLMWYFWSRLDTWAIIALTLVELIFVPDLRNLGTAMRGSRNEAVIARDPE